MLVTELYNGQGFGNQLWSYVFTRVLALDKNVEFGIQSPERFKGTGFLDLDMGQKVIGGSGPEGGPPTELPSGIEHYYSERVITHPKLDVDIRTLDPGFQEIIDNTKIEGVFQAEDYILHRKEDIRSWLKYEPEQLDIDFTDDNMCVINFRGGEYRGNPKIFLRRKYWVDAVAHIRLVNPIAKFVVITDDPSAARKFFPKFPIRHYGIHGDYQAINSAAYLILSNSSFAFFPAWLNSRVKVCLAPKYWWAHNESDGYWCCSYNIVKDWTYIDRDGSTNNFDECIEELAKFQELHSEMYEQKKISGAFVVVSSFNHDLSWLPRYAENYFVYERGSGSGIPSQLDRQKLCFVPNNGSNFKNYFSYIIDNYDSLPEVVFLINGNVFPRHVRQHVFDSCLNQKVPYSIIDRKKHRTRVLLDYFGNDGMYHELNTDWYVPTGVPWKYFQTLDSLLRYFDESFKPKMYTRFSIGGEYIVSREIIQQIPKHMYKTLLEIVSHGGQPIGYTAECYIVERALDTLWQSKLGSSPHSDARLDHLLKPSGVKEEKTIFKKVEFALIDLTAQVINIPRSFTILACGAIRNRYKLVQNYFSK